MNYRVPVSVIIGTIVLSCSYHKDEVLVDPSDCNSVTSTYSGVVKPLIEVRCAVAGCHSAGSVNGPGALDSYQRIRNAAPMIRSAVQSGFMPEGSVLTESQKQSIICWIDRGSPNN